MVSSFAPPKGFGVPSLANKATSQHVDPRASVGSYVNQQLAGLFSGTSATVGPSSSTDSLNAAAGSSGVDLGGVQKRIGGISDQIKGSNERVRMYSEAARAKKQNSFSGIGGQWLGVDGMGRMRGGGPGVSGSSWKPNSRFSDSRNRALQLASSYVGRTPYVLGGRSYQGIDCSGLVMAVYSQLGYRIPVHHAGWQGQNIPGRRTSIANLQPGDIVAWRDGSHIAIYAGNGNIIEAARPGTAVRVHPLWSNDVYGIALSFPGDGK